MPIHQFLCENHVYDIFNEEMVKHSKYFQFHFKFCVYCLKEELLPQLTKITKITLERRSDS